MASGIAGLCLACAGHIFFSRGHVDVVRSSSQTSTPKVVGRAALFHGMEWALDWFGRVKQQGRGPVIFLKDDGGHFYVCGGIDSYDVDKFVGEEGCYDFHLTTCFDSGGVELPGKYKKVSLHLSGFAGYDMNVVALPSFDRSKKLKAVQMVGPIEFLKKTSCYNVTGFKVKVDSNVRLSTPFMSAETLREVFEGIWRTHKHGESKQGTLRSALGVGTEGGTHSTRTKNTAPTEKVFVVTNETPSPQDGFPKPGNTKEKSSKAAKAPSVFSRRAQHRKKVSPRNKDEENVEWDTRGVPSSSHCPDRDDGVDEREGKSSEQGAEEGSMRGDATEGDGDERESGEATGDDNAREDEGGGDEGEDGEEEENPEGESREEEENPGDAEERTPHGSKNNGRDEDSDEEESGGETDRDIEVAGTQASANSRKREMHSERRRAEIIGLGASHTSYVQHLERQSGKLEKERHERPAKIAKKKVRVEGTKEVADSSDEGVGVDPRDHTAKAGKLESSAFDTTNCFFLEYDSDGNAVQRPQEIYVDCMKVLPNPVGGPVQYNVRPLNEMLVVSIMRAMKLPEKKGEWDRATWILAPVTKVAIRGQKQWVFEDLTAREKEMVLEMILDRHVVVTTGRTFNKNLLNMDDIMVEVRRERYMIRLFNYVVFKTEGRKEDEWHDEFFIGYSRIMDRFAPTGLTKEQWKENKTKVPAHKAKDVPKRLGDIDEPKVGKVGGFKLTRTLYAECPYYLKVFMHEIIGAIDQLRDELRRISANARHTACEDRLRAKTYANELDAGEHFDVLDSEGETSDEDIDLPVPGAQQDVRQALDDVKGHQAMERIETDVVASRESVRGGEQRSCEQGMQESAGNEIWGPVGATNASKNSSDDGLHAGAASLSGKEPHLQSKRKESSAIYPEILTQLDNVYVSMGLSTFPRDKQYNVPQEENAEVSRMGVNAIKFALPPDEDDKQMPGDRIRKDMKEFTGGPHFIQHIGMVWQLRKWVLESKFFEIAKEQVHIKVRQANGGSDDLVEGAYADALYDKLRDQNMLEYNANFYDIESIVSHGRIPWKLPSREVVQEFEGEICLGNSQQLGHDNGHASASAAGRPFTSFVHSDKQVHERNDIEKFVGNSDESRSDTMQTEQQLSHPPSQREESAEEKDSADCFATMESPKVCTGSESQMATDPMSMQGTELTREESVPQMKGIESLSENTHDLMLQLNFDGGVLERRPSGVQREENVDASMGKDDDELQRATTIGDKHQQHKRKREDDDVVVDIVTQSGEQSGRAEDGEVGQNEKEQEEHQHVTLQKENVICNEKPRKGNTIDNVVLRRSARPVAKKTRHDD
ncbi:hypothetical protein CBR_g52418 [Chara braunii]|uniref:Uncharacterized protein n=1 Tax=Chara braunii TaxID=69332 RepID=A0A388MAH2_CHABU|nr:hypothetical protein CBR_g52418 [Chara braunii]|eukprot:GBG91462.1 hypothetical protein CBR_g52418 [Chara braunii]